MGHIKMICVIKVVRKVIIQTSHYSPLSMMEVLGKLMFASVAGFLIDIVGLEMVFVLFVAFAIMTVPLLLKMPDFHKIKPFCDTN